MNEFNAHVSYLTDVPNDCLDAFYTSVAKSLQYSCLCTFPFNYTDKKLSLYTIASLALLGAGVAIDANTGGFDKDCWHDKNRYILDDCVPKWIREEIRRNLGMKTEDIDLKNEQL